ncbi:hypothetical protein GCM10020000_52390 [Streptomyces olivoverticillatus]
MARGGVEVTFGGGRVVAPGGRGQGGAQDGLLGVVGAARVRQLQAGGGPFGGSVGEQPVGGGPQGGDRPVLGHVVGGEEVVRDLGGRGARPVGEGGGAPVERGRLLVRDAVEDGQACGGVPEGGAVQQAGGVEGGDGAGRGGGGDAGEFGGALGGGVPVQDGQRPGQFGGGLPAPVETGEDGLREGEAGAAPVVDEGAQQQRVAAARVVELCDELFVVGRGAAAGEDGGDGGRSERFQAQPGEVRVAQEFGAQDGVVAALVHGLGEEEEHACPAGAAGEVQQVAAGEVVDEVEVVDADHHGRGGAEPVDGGAEGLHGLDAGGGAVARFGCDGRQGAGRCGGGQLAQDAEREFAFRFGADGAQDQRPRAGCALRDGVGQFALAAADGPLDEYDACVARPGSRRARIPASRIRFRGR